MLYTLAMLPSVFLPSLLYFSVCTVVNVRCVNWHVSSQLNMAVGEVTVKLSSLTAACVLYIVRLVVYF